MRISQRRQLFGFLFVFAIFAGLAWLDSQAESTGAPAMAVIAVAAIPTNELGKKRKDIIANARALVDRAAGEKRDLTAEESKQFGAAMDDAAAIKAEQDRRHEADRAAAERARLLQDAENDLRAPNTHNVDLNNFRGSAAGAGPTGNLPNAEDYALAVQGWFANQSGRSDVLVTQAQVDAANRVGIRLNARELVLNLRQDYSNLRRELRNALSSGTGGGYLKPTGLMDSIEVAMLWYGSMLQTSDVMRTPTGVAMGWPTVNDTSNEGRQIGENRPVNESNPTFKQQTWGAHQFTSDEILVPFGLLRDTPYNLTQTIGDLIGMRLGRAINRKATTGNGANTMFGIVNAATVGKTAAATNAIAFDEIKDMYYSVDAAYRDAPGAGWMMHDDVIKVVAKIKDSNGQYMWEPSNQAGEPDTLQGKPVTSNNHMANTLAANAISMIFGALDYYKIRQVDTIRVYHLQERHRENDQDAFLGFTEADGNLLDAGTSPVKSFKQAAS